MKCYICLDETGNVISLNKLAGCKCKNFGAHAECLAKWRTCSNNGSTQRCEICDSVRYKYIISLANVIKVIKNMAIIAALVALCFIKNVAECDPGHFYLRIIPFYIPISPKIANIFAWTIDNFAVRLLLVCAEIILIRANFAQ